MQWSFWHIIIAIIVVAPAVAFVSSFAYGLFCLATGREE
jgi:hypothetical protein